MTDMVARLFAVMRKEFLQIFRMKGIMPIVVGVPVLQMVIFSYAAVLDVRNITLGVIDRDLSASSRSLVRTLSNSGYFLVVDLPEGERDIDECFKRGLLCGCLVIPSNFERDLKRRGRADVQINADGCNSTVATALISYASAACAAFSEDGRNRGSGFSVQTRLLYNPSGENKFFFIPGLFGMILLIAGMPLTAISLVREKEQGTFEQLNVTPVSPFEIILGKIAPYMLLTLVMSTVMILVAVVVFGLPMRGSLAVVYFGLALFLFAALGLGVFVSIVSSTQQQAVLTSFLILLPMMLFSGFMFPVENMDGVFRVIAEVNPFTHLLRIMRFVFLKGASFAELSHDFVMIALVDALVFASSVCLFSKRSS